MCQYLLINRLSTPTGQCIWNGTAWSTPKPTALALSSCDARVAWSRRYQRAYDGWDQKVDLPLTWLPPTCVMLLLSGLLRQGKMRVFSQSTPLLSVHYTLRCFSPAGVSRDGCLSFSGWMSGRKAPKERSFPSLRPVKSHGLPLPTLPMTACGDGEAVEGRKSSAPSLRPPTSLLRRPRRPSITSSRPATLYRCARPQFRAEHRPFSNPGAAC